MIRASKPKALQPVSFSELEPGGGGFATPQADLQMSQPKAPGGNGFLINHNAFSDARPPAARGAKKSAGYPNYPVIK
jgi:hypothetical protein